MLTPEEKMMIQDIKSLINELEQADSGAGDTEEVEPVTMAIDENPKDCADDPTKKKDISSIDDITKALKALIAKSGSASPDGTTANDDAESRIYDDQTEMMDENINAVAKAIIALTSKGKPVAKSKKSSDEIRKEMLRQRVNKKLQERKQNDNVEKALVAIANVVKSVVEQQNETTMAVSNILEGLGIAQQVTGGQFVAKSITPAQRQKPVKCANQEVLKGLQDKLTNMVGDPMPAGAQRQSVAKDLSGVMGYLFNK